MPTENNYFGYIPSNSRVDWGKMTSDIADELTQAYQDRELAKQQLDDIKTVNDELVSSAEKSKTQQINDLVFSGADDARQKMLQWNKDLKAGLLSARDYKSKMNKVKDDWTIFANNMKQFDTRVQEALKRQEVGPDGKAPVGSKLDAAMNEHIAALGDLRGKKITVDNQTGKIYIGNVDPGTGILDPNSLLDASSIGNAQNQYDNRLDLIAVTKPYVDLVEAWKIQNPSGTITDAKQNPELKNSIENFTYGILGNNRTATSVLLDNSGLEYDTYFDDQEYDQKVMEKFQDKIRSIGETPKYSSDEIIEMVSKYKKRNKNATAEDLENYKNKLSMEVIGELPIEDQEMIMDEIRSKMIKVSLDDNGIYQPELTKNQIDDAQGVIESLIYTGIPRTVTLPAKLKSSGTGGKGKGKSTEGSTVNYTLYDKSKKAYDKMQSGDTNPINLMLANKGYRVVITAPSPDDMIQGNYDNSYVLYKVSTDQSGMGEDKVVGRISSLEDLAPFLGFATGTASKSSEGETDFITQKQASEADKGIKSSGFVFGKDGMKKKN
jgi:hypothetical protein